MKIQAAIIGCGRVAGGYDQAHGPGGCFTHAGAYRLCPDVELVAAVDPDPSRLAEFGKSWNVTHLYAHTEDLLKKHPVQIVSVCVPDAFHESVVSQVLQIRPPKVIFAEKPFTLESQAAKTLWNASRAANSRIVINYQRRWERGHQQARDLIQSGGIGQVVTATAFYVKGLYHMGCTAIDTLRFLVSEVDCVRSIGEASQATTPTDPSVDAVLHLKNGATAVLLGADRIGYRYSIFELDILGTTGRIRISENGQSIRIFRAQPDPRDPSCLDLQEKNAQTIPSDMGSAIPNGMRQIVRFVSGQGEPPDSDAQEAYRNLCVLDAISLSKSRQGALVPVVSS